MDATEWINFPAYIAQFEREGLVTRTFRRLDAERQQAVIQAILEEAVAKGPTSLNIKEVAARAGVAVGSLYAYFGSRDGLLTFAVRLCVHYMNDLFEISRPFLMAMPFREALKSYLNVGIEWSKTQVGLIRFFARAAYHSDSELSDQVVRPIALAMRGIVREMLAQAIERGEVRADIDVEATARVVHALTIAVSDSQILPYLNTYFQISDETISAERVLDALIALIMDGIGAKKA
jgi:AcrR family transcriptional regulator